MLHVDDVQHICLHTLGWPFATTHSWKQAMLIAHCPLFKHCSVSLQQPPMTHWLHGVPPGSSEQGPASGGAIPQ